MYDIVYVCFVYVRVRAYLYILMSYTCYPVTLCMYVCIHVFVCGGRCVRAYLCDECACARIYMRLVHARECVDTSVCGVRKRAIASMYAFVRMCVSSSV